MNGIRRQVTLRELGVRWYYWLIAFGFGAASAVSFWAIRLEPENRLQLAICGSFLGTICLLSGAWPLLRVMETQGVKRETLRLNLRSEPAILFPLSKVKVWIAAIGAVAFAAFGGASVFLADSGEHRVRGGIAMAFFGAVLVVLGRNLIRWRPGIFISSSGIDWRESFGSRHIISWDQFVWADVYEHREQYATVRSVGLLLRSLDQISSKRRVREQLLRNFSAHGFHLYLHSESVLIPLEILARTLQFYASNPEARNELVDGTAYGRIARAGFPADAASAPLGAKLFIEPFQKAKEAP